MNTNNSSTLVVYGGGRWGRLIVSILMGMDLPYNKVVIVSKVNSPQIQSLIDSASSLRCEFVVIPDLNQLQNLAQ